MPIQAQASAIKAPCRVSLMPMTEKDCQASATGSSRRREPASGQIDSSSAPWGGCLYHHCRALEHVVFGVVRQALAPADDDLSFDGAYRWLEAQVGFFPLFLAVGSTDEDVRMTGYCNQWRRYLGGTLLEPIYRSRGDVPSIALLSFRDLPASAVFTDYNNWHIALNHSYDGYRLTRRETAMILRPSWTTADWLRQARRKPHSVQLVVPELDLRCADAVAVRNRAARQYLESLGFRSVHAHRLSLQPDDGERSQRWRLRQEALARQALGAASDV